MFSRFQLKYQSYLFYFPYINGDGGPREFGGGIGLGPPIDLKRGGCGPNFGGGGPYLRGGGGPNLGGGTRPYFRGGGGMYLGPGCLNFCGGGGMCFCDGGGG